MCQFADIDYFFFYCVRSCIFLKKIDKQIKGYLYGVK